MLCKPRHSMNNHGCARTKWIWQSIPTRDSWAAMAVRACRDAATRSSDASALTCHTILQSLTLVGVQALRSSKYKTVKPGSQNVLLCCGYPKAVNADVWRVLSRHCTFCTFMDKPMVILHSKEIKIHKRSKRRLILIWPHKTGANSPFWSNRQKNKWW